MHFPTWVDLKGEDSVPDTVHHVVVIVDPIKDQSWKSLQRRIPTDGVHVADHLAPGSPGNTIKDKTCNDFPRLKCEIV